MSGSSEAKGPILQPFGSLRAVRLGLTPETCSRSVRALNRLLAHAMALRDLYKKAHWQTSGAAVGARGRGARRRWHQRHHRERSHPHERVAGLARRRTPRWQ